MRAGRAWGAEGSLPCQAGAGLASPAALAGQERHPAERGAAVAQDLEGERLDQGREYGPAEIGLRHVAEPSPR